METFFFSERNLKDDELAFFCLNKFKKMKLCATLLWNSVENHALHNKNFLLSTKIAAWRFLLIHSKESPLLTHVECIYKNNDGTIVLYVLSDPEKKIKYL